MVMPEVRPGQGAFIVSGPANNVQRVLEGMDFLLHPEKKGCAVTPIGLERSAQPPAEADFDFTPERFPNGCA